MLIPSFSDVYVAVTYAFLFFDGAKVTVFANSNTMIGIFRWEKGRFLTCVNMAVFAHNHLLLHGKGHFRLLNQWR